MVGTAVATILLALVLVLCISVLKNHRKADPADRTPNHYKEDGVGGGK